MTRRIFLGNAPDGSVWCVARPPGAAAVGATALALGRDILNVEEDGPVLRRAPREGW